MKEICFKHQKDLLVFFLLLATWLFYLSAIRQVPMLNGDNAIFFGLADSISNQGTYHFNGRPHTRFPPGFPALIAILAQISGNNIYFITGFFCLLFSLGLFLSYLMVKEKTSTSIAAFSVCCIAFSPYTLRLNTEGLVSDPTGFFLTTLALYLGVKLEDKEGTKSWADLIFFPLVVVLAIFVRSASIALLGALALKICCSIFHSIKGQGSRLKLLTPFTLALAAGLATQVAWMNWIKANRKQFWEEEFMNSYLSQIKLKDPHYPDLGFASWYDLVERVASNLKVQSAHFMEVVLQVEWIAPRFYSPVVVLALILSLLGLLHFVRQGLSLRETFTISHLGLFLIWPFDEQSRFILPIIPFLCLYMFKGLEIINQLFLARPQNTSKGIALFSALFSIFTIACHFLAKPLSGIQDHFSLLFWLCAASLFFLIPRTNSLVKLACSTLTKLSGPIKLVLLILPLIGLWKQQRLASEHREISPFYYHTPSVLAGAWLKKHSPENSIVMAETNALLHIASKRKVVRLPATASYPTIAKVIKQSGAQFLVIILNDSGYVYHKPAQEIRLSLLNQNYPKLLQLVRKGFKHKIYKIVSQPKANSLDY